MVADQLEGVPGFQVLRKDHDADVGMIGANLSGRAEPVVGFPWRHLNVRDDDVGSVSADLANQVGRVVGYSDHFKSGLFEHRHDARANERLDPRRPRPGIAWHR